MKPKYCKNVIVGVTYKKTFRWYITDKDFWYLDYVKEYKQWKECYQKLGRSEKQFHYDIGTLSEFCSKRWGIQVIEGKNIDFFLNKIEKYKVSVQELNKMFHDSEYTDSCYPSFYVNFDRKEFYSYFPEPERFENFVPDGWFHSYQLLDEVIPKNERYWI